MSRSGGESGVPLEKIIACSIDIYEEWKLIEEHRDIFDPGMATAYQEGVLRSLRLLNSRFDITIETMDPKARDRLGVGGRDPGGSTRKDTAPAEEPSRFDSVDDDPGECPECGEERIWMMGREDPFCHSCDG